MAARFIGRTRELATLTQALQRSAARQGQVVSITGGPGIGKTRLLSALAEFAGDQGHQVLWSQLFEDPGAPPYFPWMLALRAHVQACDDSTLRNQVGDCAEDLACVLPELATRLGLSQQAPTAVPGTATRFRMGDAVTRFLLSAASHRPLLLLFDNLHLIDRASLDLLSYFCHQIASQPVLVVAARRDAAGDGNDDRGFTLARIDNTARFEHITLDGFSAGETAEALYLILGYPPSPGLASAIQQQSDGNPLFVCEVGAMLARQSASALPAAGTVFQIPDTLGAVIAARLDTLPGASLALLSRAAVLGREFRLEDAASCADCDPDTALQQLAPPLAEGILGSRGPGRYHFHHALFREVLYSRYSKAERMRWHRVAARQLEHRLEAEPALLPQLAYHWFQAAAGEYAARAVHYCRRAAEVALARRAYGEAASWFDMTLQAAELGSTADLRRRFDLQLAHGNALYHSGQLASALQTLLRAALLAHRQQWWRELAGAAIELQTVVGQLGVSHIASVPLHQAALRQLPEGERILRARLLASLSIALRMSGKSGDADNAIHRSIALARATGDADTLLDSIYGLMWRWAPGGHRERLVLNEEALKLSATAASERRLRAMQARLYDLLWGGEVPAARELLAEFRRLAQAVRYPHFINIALGIEVDLDILQGRWQEALRGSLELQRRARFLDVLGLEGYAGFQMFTLQKLRGKLQSIAPLMRRMECGQHAGRLWLPGRLLLHCELGHEQQARELLETMGPVERLVRDDLATIILVYLAEVCSRLHDLRRCEEIYELLVPHRGLTAFMPSTVILGAVSGYLAILASELRRTRLAATLFEEALEMNAAMEAAPFLARTQIDFAGLLLQRGHRDDHQRGLHLLNQAAALAGPLQMQPLLIRIDQLRNGAAGAGLTRREIQILELIAAGAGNQAIADTLFVSHSTVATHVRNILRKIGARNRTEAADYARRAALISPR